MALLVQGFSRKEVVDILTPNMNSMGNPGLQPPGSTLNSLVPPWNSWVVRSGCQVSNVQSFGFPKIQEWYLGLESERIFSVGSL